MLNKGVVKALWIFIGNYFALEKSKSCQGKIQGSKRQSYNDLLERMLEDEII